MSFQSNSLKTTGEVALKTIFLFQFGVGTLANVILFFCNVSTVVLGLGWRPTHVILTHLALANSLVLLSPGIPHIMAAFVHRNPLSSLGCKLVYYIQILAHSTTLCSTCVLTVYQFVTLTTGRPTVRKGAPRDVFFFCSICWMFSAFMNIYIPFRVTGPQSTSNYSDAQDRWFCSSLRPAKSFIIMWFISDASFIGLMSWASGSMVLLLQRHRQKLWHIHTPRCNHKCPPETRATHTILMLVVAFVTLYILNSSFAFYAMVLVNSHQWLMRTSHILASCFPTLSPVLLILRNPRTPHSCSWAAGSHR